VFIKILYAVLVLCMVAVGGAIVAGYFRIRRHMNGSGKAATGHEAAAPQVEQEVRR
jgi:hypothetical protein